MLSTYMEHKFAICVLSLKKTISDHVSSRSTRTLIREDEVCSTLDSVCVSHVFYMCTILEFLYPLYSVRFFRLWRSFEDYLFLENVSDR